MKTLNAQEKHPYTAADLKPADVSVASVELKSRQEESGIQRCTVLLYNLFIFYSQCKYILTGTVITKVYRICDETMKFELSSRPNKYGFH
jgi:hypothetical protein